MITRVLPLKWEMSRIKINGALKIRIKARKIPNPQKMLIAKRMTKSLRLIRKNGNWSRTPNQSHRK